MKATNIILLLYLCFIAGSTIIAAMTRESTPYSFGDPQESRQQNNFDRQFINEAITGGRMEVEMGNLAKEKAQSLRVKRFADMMVRDHSKANSELEALLKQKQYTVAAKPEEEKKEDHAASLKSLTGRDFDKAYMKMMVKDHDKDLELFTKQSTKGSDSDLRSFAIKTLPVLKMHLDSAKAIHSDLDKATIY